MMSYMPGFSYTDQPSLVHLLPSLIARLNTLDTTTGGELLGLPACRRYVLVMVDGLGWDLLHRSLIDAPYLSYLVGDAVKVSAGLPSTTATSLLSLWTGLTPGSHGIVGFSFAEAPTDGQPASRLIRPLAIQDPMEAGQTLMDRLVADGVAVSWVVPPEHIGSGLTHMGAGRARVIGVEPADVPQRIQATCLAAQSADRSLVYVYERRLDHVGHRYGVGSEAWRRSLNRVDDFLDRLRAELPPDTCLLVIGDHGMIDVPPGARIDIDADPALSRDLCLIGGEARFRHLYTKSPEAVAARWRDRLGDSGMVVTRDEAIDAGYFGPVDPRYRGRIGDVVVMASGTQAYLTAHFPGEYSLVGMHGSWTQAERYVPLLIDDQA